MANLRPARVSRVSPDCEMMIVSDVRIGHGVPVAEFGGQIDLDREAQQSFEDVFADQAGMEGRAAGDNDDFPVRGQVLPLEAQFRQHDAEVIPIQLAGKRLAERPGLLVDLLEHEILVAALLRRHRVPVDMEDGLGDLPAVQLGRTGLAPR